MTGRERPKADDQGHSASIRILGCSSWEIAGGEYTARGPLGSQVWHNHGIHTSNKYGASMDIRHVVEKDFPAIAALLNHYILHSDARYFEHESVPLSTREPWLRSFAIASPHQMFVASGHDEILGFCCSQPYRPESVYDATIETTIYLSPELKSQGLGTALYTCLFDSLEHYPLHCALAGIVMPNAGSVALHRKMGFREVGVFDEYGKTGDRFISSVWMQKRLPGFRDLATA